MGAYAGNHVLKERLENLTIGGFLLSSRSIVAFRILSWVSGGPWCSGRCNEKLQSSITKEGGSISTAQSCSVSSLNLRILSLLQNGSALSTLHKISKGTSVKVEHRLRDSQYLLCSLWMLWGDYLKKIWEIHPAWLTNFSAKLVGEIDLINQISDCTDDSVTTYLLITEDFKSKAPRCKFVSVNTSSYLIWIDYAYLHAHIKPAGLDSSDYRTDTFRNT